MQMVKAGQKPHRFLPATSRLKLSLRFLFKAVLIRDSLYRIPVTTQNASGIFVKKNLRLTFINWKVRQADPEKVLATAGPVRFV